MIKDFKDLPETAKVINTDHRSSYLSKNTQAYLSYKKIKHSLGKVGCSYDNRWIGDFWKRLKYEWFTQYPTNNLNPSYIQDLSNE